MSTRPVRREIYRYQAPWALYAMGWSQSPRQENSFRLALGSFIEEYSNKVQVVVLDPESGEFTPQATIDHPYPCTKLMWCPDPAGQFPDLVATSGDYLRIFRIDSNHAAGARQECLLNNNKEKDFCAPLTSFDWSEVDQKLIGTSSIDTTCTIWEVETGAPLARVPSRVQGRVKTQLIAHENEVYDIAFSRATAHGFASVGGDGSVRMFDLRHLEHSTIIYEARRPLLRLAWNRQDPNYIAALAMDVSEVIILDVRVPCTPVAKLSNHRAAVNGVAWAPHSSCHVCTAGDDKQALIWDIQQMPRAIEDPILAYNAAGEINTVHWGPIHNDWIAITYDHTLEILRV